MKSRFTNRRSRCWSDCPRKQAELYSPRRQDPRPERTRIAGSSGRAGLTLPIVFLTGHGDIPTTVRAIKAGAEDFLTKPVPKEKLIAAIERAVARHQAMREQRDRLSALRALMATLTPREREVFEHVVQGKMNKQIAHELGTTERTIKAHRQKVMEKMRVQSLAELVSIAERLGIQAKAAAAVKDRGDKPGA